MLRILTKTNMPAGCSTPSEVPYIEAAGLSTDTKPTDCMTGSLYIEVDTGKAYFYDEVGAQWIEAGGSNV